MSDREFYERRLREELARSATEVDATVRALHGRWTQLYRDRIDRLGGASLDVAA